MGHDRRCRRSAARTWWALIILPAMAVSACGGSRLTHDAIVAAVNGGPVLSAQAYQQGVVSGVPQNSTGAPAPGASAIGGVGGSGAGNATSITGAKGTGAGGAAGGGTSSAGAGGGVGPASAKPASPLAPILLGNVGTYSGPVGSALGGTDTMVQVWAQWTNAHGGIAGHPVQVFTADDGGDPARSVSLVKDMVENKHVIAFLANQAVFTLKAQLAYLHHHNIPIIGGDMTSPTWTSDSLAFPVGTTIGEAVFGDLKVAHQRDLIKLGIFACVESTSCTFVRDYTVNGGASRAGEDVVYKSDVTITQPDYTAECLGAQAAGAQVVFLAVEANSIMRVAASCSRQNYHPVFMTISLAVTNALESDPQVEGMYATAQVFPWMLGSTPATAQFQQAAQQYAPSLRLSGATAVAWVSGQVLAKVAARSGAQPTSQDILNGLWSLHNETVDGLAPPLNYVQNQPAPPVSCYFMIEMKGGKWTAPSGDSYACA